MKKHLFTLTSLAALSLSVQASEIKEIHYILCGNEPTIGLTDYIKEFEAKHSDVKINLEMVSWNQCQDKATNLAIAGDAPAMAYMGARVLKQLHSGGMTVEIPLSEEEKQSYYPSMLEAVSSDGQILGLPVAASTRALFYNKDLFEKADLDPNMPPKTWDELYEMGKAIKEKTGIYAIGLAGKAHDSTFLEYLNFAAGNGVKIVDEKGDITFDTENNAEALTHFAKLKDIAVDNPTSMLRADFNNIFNQQNVAMHINGPWFRNQINEDINWGIAPVPHGPKNEASSILIVDSMAIFKDTGVEDIAIEFAKYITNPENQFRYEKEYGLTPVRPVAGVDELMKEDPSWIPFIEATKNAIAEPLIEDYRAMQDIVIDTIQAVLLEDKSVKEALEDGQTDLEDLD